MVVQYSIIHNFFALVNRFFRFGNFFCNFFIFSCIGDKTKQKQRRRMSKETLGSVVLFFWLFEKYTFLFFVHTVFNTENM